MTLLERAEAYAQLSQAYFKAVVLQEREARAMKAANELEQVREAQNVMAKEIASQEAAISSSKLDATALPIRL